MSKNIIVIADRGAGNYSEALGLVFHHQGSTFINAYCKVLQTWLIETEGNIVVMIYLSQGGLRSPIASFSFSIFTSCLLF